MDRLERLKKKIESDQIALGTFVTLQDPAVSEMIAWSGFDFLWIDGEHAALTSQEILGHIRTAQGAGTAVFVRVPWNDPVLIKPVLDMGPDGVIIPFIRNAEEARQAVAACKYPPEGVRGYNPVRAAAYGLISPSEYISSASSRIWCIPQVELKECVDDIESVLAVEGIDALLAGPMDLSGSIGKLGQLNDPEVKSLYDRIGQAVSAAGVPLATAVGIEDPAADDWVRRGVKLLSVGSDFGFLTHQLKKTVDLYS